MMVDVEAALAQLVAQRHIVPYDETILGALLADCRDTPEILRAVQQLLTAGTLRIVQVGSEPHLALGRHTAPKQDSSVPKPNVSAKPQTSDSKLEIAIDAEAERLVLYRVALVFLIVIGLLLLRQIGLAIL